MIELKELLSEAEILVNRAVRDINSGEIGLTEVEERVLEYVNQVGSLLVERVVDDVDDPIQENRVWVDGALAQYKDSAPMKIRNRLAVG